MKDSTTPGRSPTGKPPPPSAKAVAVPAPGAVSHAPGASWKANEQHVLPKNNLPLVFFGFMLAIFLAAIDQTIVATALPTISARLGGGSNYSWVGSAYLLASAACSPFYGKFSNIVGRKPVIFGSIFIFLIGSALCGAAKTINWLIICRAIQGVGGGGIMQVRAQFHLPAASHHVTDPI